jgi:alpha-galactosidase
MSVSIKFDEARKTFLLECGNFSYAFAVNSKGHLINLHWGGIIDRIEDLPEIENFMEYRHRSGEQSLLSRQEYPAWGGEFYCEPALKACFNDKTRVAFLIYKDAEIKREEDYELLTVTMEEPDHPLQVQLFYRIWKDSHILERWTEISNTGNDSTTILDSIMSATWHPPRIDGDYRLSHLAGRWGREGMINRLPVKQNKIVLESRTGLSGPFAMPFFALDQGDATEQMGRVWFGTVQWSGNWKITIECDAFEEISITGGINDFDFSYPLEAGQTFTSPIFSVGVSENGFGEASRIMHHYQRNNILPPVASQPIPLLVNTWASLHADVDEKSVLAVAEKAAEVGAELFVIDDGWQAALGDWTPDTEKFPNGLKPVIDSVKESGMDFGLWVEIESFEKKSNLYKKHPEWAMQFSKRKPPFRFRGDVDRTSYLINFAREDVLEHFYKELHKLILETGIAYLKLDMNCFFTDPGWDEVSDDKTQTIWYHYTKNIHRLFERLNEDFPEVRFENCASGGCRSDLGMSYFFSRINRSDNQDPLDVLKLHEGFTWLHLPGLAGGACHISDMFSINQRRVPLGYQAVVGMLGSLAIGKDLSKCPDEEITTIRYWGDLYKRFRSITYHGDLYRLVSHNERPYAIFEYVAQDRKSALLFVINHASQFGNRLPSIPLQGLDPETIYNIEIFSASENNAGDYHLRSGKALMELGIQTQLLGDYDAKIIYFTENK